MVSGPMVTGSQLVCHAVGDYVIQSDWMASEKTSKHWPAAAHAVTYALPFLFLTRSPRALLIIAVTHFIIDRWRLARHLLGEELPISGRQQSIVGDVQGDWLPPEKPLWLSVWLMIIADNTLHVLINALALRKG